MSLLAPLYIAGLLAISLPIIFHLIRRTPHGQQQFSSLMFLTPSPPRLTRRSRLSNILLLILRAVALTLLAFAFARPFFNQKADADITQSRGRRIAILVDTSASMQRGDLWQQATQQVDRVIDGLAASDEVSLYFYDRAVRPAFTFSEWNEQELSRRAPLLRSRLSEAKPTWSGTNLADALATVADAVAESEGSRSAADTVGRQIILVSDLQQGSHVESLQGYEWPDNVVLDVKTVALKQTSNASVQIVKESTDATTGAAEAQQKLRVRVNNQPDSTREQFSLAWANEKGAIASLEPATVYVPPGRGKIVRIAWPEAQHQADRLVLAGDDFDFDNTLHVVPPRQDHVRVLYLGDDNPDDAKGLRYYIQRAIAPTPQREVEFVARTNEEPLGAADLTGTRLVMVTSAQSDQRAAALRQFAEQGGDVLWVLKDLDASNGLSGVTQVATLQITEATVRNYSLIGRVVLDHPLFAPFADARYGDFTKIRFWKHRKVGGVESSSGINVLAVFDGGDPFLLEKPIGQGRLIVATSGWHPADSQLALSTKFVPLIDGLLHRRDDALVEAQYSVNDRIALPARTSADQKLTLQGPDGRQIELPSTATTFDDADRPGIYRLTFRQQQVPLAVNLPPDESRTTPLAVEELEQWGAKLGAKPVSDEVVAQKRQLQILELENRQKLWQWIIVAVLGLLAVETILAGCLAHRTSDQLQPQPEQVTT